MTMPPAILPPRPPERSRRPIGWILASATAVLVVAGGLFARATARERGEADARTARTVSVGETASAVLGKEAHVTWDGDFATQTSGRASWVVAPGRQLRLRTPAGEVKLAAGLVTVNVRPAVGGAPIRAIVTVTEGHASAAGTDGTIEARSGEALDVRPDGAKPFDEPRERAEASDGSDQSSEEGDDHLSAEVRDTKKRLEQVSHEKSSLEQRLKAAEDKLAERDGKKARSPYDLSKDDWTELARQGVVRYRLPCARADSSVYSEHAAVALGLTPADAPVLSQAHKRSVQRVWNAIRPLCQDALGGATPETVERLGFQSCKAIITSQAEESVSMDELFQLYRSVGEMRAGKRPLPAADAKVSPLVRLLLVLSGESAEWEKELAAHFGPEDGHRLAFAPGYCASQGSEQGGNVPADALAPRKD